MAKHESEAMADNDRQLFGAFFITLIRWEISLQK